MPGTERSKDAMPLFGCHFPSPSSARDMAQARFAGAPEAVFRPSLGRLAELNNRAKREAGQKVGLALPSQSRRRLCRSQATTATRTNKLPRDRAFRTQDEGNKPDMQVRHGG